MEVKSLELTYGGLGTGDLKRKEIESAIMRKAKIKMLAYQGAFNDLFTHEQIYKAKKFGYLPDGYEVHHIVPLCCTNTSYDLNNMVVIDKRSHTWIHNNLYTPSLAMCKEGQSCAVWVPAFDPTKVFTHKDLEPFIHEWNTVYLAKYGLKAKDNKRKVRGRAE